MSAIRGIFTDGHIVLGESVDWPEGIEVFVEPALPSSCADTADDIQGDTPDSIARWLAWYDSLEPLVFAPDEEAALARDREKRKEAEKEAFGERAERLREIFP